MFYQPGITDHNLPYDPFKGCVVPRPIGWITTLNTDGSTNLAPYSHFNNLSLDPPLIMFSANRKSDGSRKDSVVNAEREKEFTWSLATWDLREQVNITSEEVSYGTDEYTMAKLTREVGNVVKTSMVAESPVKFECRFHSSTHIPGNGTKGSIDIVIGRVVGIHISDNVMTDGKVDVLKTKPIARLGYSQYTVISEPSQVFEMIRPGSTRKA